MARPKEVTAVLRRLRSANKRLAESVDRAAEVDLLPGHRAELIRQLRGVREAAAEAVEAFGGRR